MAGQIGAEVALIDKRPLLRPQAEGFSPPTAPARVGAVPGAVAVAWPTSFRAEAREEGASGSGQRRLASVTGS